MSVCNYILNAVGDKIIVKDLQIRSNSNLILTHEDSTTRNRCVVLSIGENIGIDVKIGDVIIVNSRSGEYINKRDKVRVIKSSDIFMIEDGDLYRMVNNWVLVSKVQRKSGIIYVVTDNTRITHEQVKIILSENNDKGVVIVKLGCVIIDGKHSFIRNSNILAYIDEDSDLFIDKEDYNPINDINTFEKPEIERI